ncbi:MAG: FAD-dependent oxidoreductase [Lachnospiraceae bacterium]|nr:FAD-dependent oxidoreductase [Lachnospiraceae bacterium]
MEVYGNYDVIVVGGGASGCAAAIESARTGAKTILIETLGIVGGMVNVVGPPGWAFAHLWNEHGEDIIGGFVKETHDILEREGHALPYPAPQDRSWCSLSMIDPDHYGLLMFRMLRDYDVSLLLHTMAVDVLKEGDTVCGVVVENTNGRQAVMGKVVIEASGEGDIAVRAGVPYTKIDRTKEEIDPPSITFHMDGIDWNKVTQYYKEHIDQLQPIRNGIYDKEMRRIEGIRQRALECDSILDLVRIGVLGNLEYADLSMKAMQAGDLEPYGDLGHFMAPRSHDHFQAVFQHTAQIKDCDTTDVTEWSYGESEARRQIEIAIKAINKYLPGYENAYLTRVTAAMRTREGRHFIADYQMQTEDVVSSRKFPDVIAKCMQCVNEGGPFHTAGNKNVLSGESNEDSDLSVAMASFTKFKYPQDGGSYDIPYRCMVPKGVEGMLITGKCLSLSEDFKRDLLPDNIVWGQAAGIAAALCVRDCLTPRELEDHVEDLQAILLEHGAILYGTK